MTKKNSFVIRLVQGKFVASIILVNIPHGVKKLEFSLFFPT